MSTPTQSFASWIPFKIRRDNTDYRIDWCYLGRERFTDPFFEQTIAHCLRKPFNQFIARETSMEPLIEWCSAQPGLPPAAFIFHGSRCGSTLLAQMAAALPCTVTISEAPPVDHVLRARVPEDTRIEWLRALLSALGQPRQGDERHLVVKLDAWHVLNLALIQRAFPAVPCIYLYREPAAVIASQQRMPGLHMVPGMLDAESNGSRMPDILHVDPNEYAGRVLGTFYAAAAAHAGAGRVTLMNYSELPAAGVLQVLAWCGLAASPESRRRIEHVCEFDAKSPSLPYDPTDAGTRPLPTQRARDVAARFVDPYYLQLESMRRTPGVI